MSPPSASGSTDMNAIWIALSISGVAMLMCLAILAVNIKIYTEIVKRADHERRYRESGPQCRPNDQAQRRRDAGLELQTETRTRRALQRRG